MAQLQHVRGLEEVKRNMAALPRELARKALRKGPARGVQVVKRAVLALTPPPSRYPQQQKRARPLTGTLRRALRVVFARDLSNDTQATYRLFFRAGKRYSNTVNRKGADTSSNAFYAPWVERGHRIVPRFRGKYTDYARFGRGRRTQLAARRRAAAAAGRRTRPVEMMARGYGASQQQAIAAIVAGLTEGLRGALK